MKIALITDTHWGIRNDNVVFHDNTKKFLDDIFFPRIRSENITNVIHLGDIVDRRKYINFLTASRLRNDFLAPLQSMGVSMDIIAGNHDVYYKNTNSINALTELIDERYKNVRIFTEATTVLQEDGTPILYLPWINEENRNGTEKEISATRAQIVLGHLEILGFEMFRGSVSTHGDDPNMFDRFDLVCSGHYHHKSSSGNICYLGSHSQFTWSDYGDDRGFHILDTQTREIEFVRNPYNMFEKVWYDDQNKTITDILKLDFNQYKSKLIKVIVSSKNNPYWFDMFIDNLEKANPSDIQIVEDHLNLTVTDDSEIVNEAESTLDIFKSQIKLIDENVINKVKLEKTIVDLYSEALAVE
jgi:DNA repair exonuclease SbcCD nuclease subunit